MARYIPKISPGVEAIKFDGTAKSADEIIQALEAPYGMQWITNDDSSDGSKVKLLLAGAGPDDHLRCEVFPGHYVLRYEHDSRMDLMSGSVFEDRYVEAKD